MALVTNFTSCRLGLALVRSLSEHIEVVAVSHNADAHSGYENVIPFQAFVNEPDD